MALGTTDRRAPPLFRQGLPLRLRWAAWSALALALLFADGYWGVARPLRVALSAALAPIQAIGTSPVRWVQNLGQHFADLNQAQSKAAQADLALVGMGLQNAQLAQLRAENLRLRQLLDVRNQRFAQALTAEVLFATADPYSRKVLINKGLQQGVQIGSAVLGAHGVIGQITQVYPRSAEVSLLVGQNATIPVRNQRTGTASVAYGLPTVGAGGVELKHLPSNADVQVGDVLTTSGMDGVYPPDLAVATVTQVERKTSTTFARVYAQPVAQMSSSYVLVLAPVGLADLDPQALANVQPKATKPARDARSKGKPKNSDNSPAPAPASAGVPKP
jgi:rod shape-determining protein MreC